MSKFRIAKVLTFFSQFLVLTVIFIVPLFFGYFSLENNLFELPKMVLFKILVLLLLIIYCCQSFFGKENKNDILVFEQKNLIIFSLVAIFLFFHSIFLTINPANSLYGLYDRQQGLISLIYYFLFFYLFIKTVKSQQINLVLSTVIFSSLLVSVYGFCQWFGIDFVNWTEPATLTHRIFSSLGQPVFLGSYLVLVIPMSFFLFFTSKYWLKSIFYLLVITIQCIALFLTYSLTAWASLIFGIISIYTFFIFFLYSQKNTSQIESAKKKFVLSSCLMLLLVLGLLFYGLQKDWMLKSKLATIVNLRGGSAQSRTIFWQASLKAIKDRPFFGYGLENQGEILVKYYNQQWAEVERVNMLSNRAHNIFLDILLTTGIFGLIIFLVVLVFVFKLVYDNCHNNRESLLSVFLAIALLAFLLSLQFSFLFVTAGVYLALYIGTLLVIGNNQQRGSGDVIISRDNGIKIIFKIIIFLGIAAVLSVLIYNNFNKLVADQYFRSILQSNHDGNFYAQVNLYDYIEELGQENSFYNQQFILLMNDARRNPIYQKMQFNEVEDRTKRIIDKTIENSFSEKLTGARAYAILSVNDKNNYDISNKLYQELIDYSPGLPLLYYEAASLGQIQKDYSKAEEYYQQFLSVLPDLASPLLNSDHKQEVVREKIQGLIGLGDVLVEQKKWEDAKKYYTQAQALDDKNSLVYYKIGRIFYLQRDFKQAISYNKKASELEPGYYFYLYTIALMYKESGNNEEAKNYINQALILSPNAPEVLELSWEIGGGS